jgi:hypothetical protein
VSSYPIPRLPPVIAAGLLHLSPPNYQLQRLLLLLLFLLLLLLLLLLLMMGREALGILIPI